MRGGYTAGALNVLLDEHIYFNYVSGISAGSLNLVNYLARLPRRSHRNFVEIVDQPEFGGMKSLISGTGIFNMPWLYGDASEVGGFLELDYDATLAHNPACFRIGAFNTRLGTTVYFSEKSIDTKEKLIQACRASSSMPIVTPPTLLEGDYYVDGGVGKSGGIPLDVAIDDGFTKFVIMLTRPRNYVKEQMRHQHVYRKLMHDFPLAADALLERPGHYNQTREQIADLEASGAAFVMYADDMLVNNWERDQSKLTENFERGAAQMRKRLPELREFLAISEV